MKRFPLAIVMVAAVGYAATAEAKPPRRSLELSLQTGYGHVFGKNGDRSHELESTNGGASVGGAVAYRTPYLFVPWGEVGWAALQWSREAPKAREFSSLAPSTSRLTATYVVAGPSVEEGVVRFRTGIGLYHQQVTSTFAGRTITPATWDMGYLLAYGVRVHDGPRFGWGIESTALLMSESQLAYLGFSVRIWGNVWADLR